MDRTLKIVMALILTISTQAFAEQLVPATSDDQAAFEQQLLMQMESEKKSQNQTTKSKDKKQKFGQIVSAEAKKLGAKNSESAKGSMGNWVSEQRRKNSAGSNQSLANDAKNSAPGLNNSGGNTNGGGNGNSNGNSGKNK